MPGITPIIWAVVSGSTNTYTISGTINDSAGAGLSGVTVTLTGDASDSTTTAGDGTYSFTGVKSGSYAVTPTKSGSTFSPTSANVTVSGADAVAATMAQVWQITGTVYDDDGAGYGSVTVALSGDASDSTVSAVDGTYSFSGLSDGSYVVTPSKVGSTFSPASSNVAVSGANGTADNMYESWSITGSVADLNDTPVAIQGATLTLTGDASDSTTSAADGTYTFSGLVNGSYTVTPTKAGYTFVPTSTNVTINGAAQTGKDFSGTTFPMVVWNAEGLSLNATDANVSYQIPDGIDDAKIQVDDYDEMGALAGSPARDLTQCFQSDGTNANGNQIYVYLGVGNGFTPSDGGIVRIESVIWSAGVAPFARVGILSDNGQEGIRAELDGNTLDIDTCHTGSWTEKATHENVFSTAPHAACWYRMALEYNFSTNAYNVYFTELGAAAATQEAVTKSGTVASPTFDSATEQHKVFHQASLANHTIGVAQLTCSDATTAFPNGYKKTANFTP